MKFSGKVGNGPMNKLLNFGGDQDPDTNPDPDLDPYRDTGKTCLGGGMHCPVLLVYNFIVQTVQGSCRLSPNTLSPRDPTRRNSTVSSSRRCELGFTQPRRMKIIFILLDLNA